MPFRTPGSDLPRRRGFATTLPVVDAFPAPWSSCEPPRSLGPRPRAPCHGNRASLNLGVVRRLLQPNSTRGHALRAVDPRTRVRLSPRCWPASPVGRCRLRWLHRCVAAPGAGEPRSARAGFHRHVPLAWTRQVTGRSTRGRRARALDDCACPSRGAPGTRVAGSTHHLAWTTW